MPEEPTSSELLGRINDAVETAEDLIEAVTGSIAALGNAVHKTGTEVISGEKNFTVSPLVPTPAATDASQKAASMAALAPVRQIAEQAKTTADAALPKAGGSMTGDVFIGGDNLELDATPEDIIGGHRLGFTDKNAAQIAALYARQNQQGENILLLLAYGKYDGATKTSGLNIVFNKNDGAAYAQCNPARGLYNSDIATMMNVMDFAAQRAAGNITVYIGSANASDTAGLNEGRGLSEAKPFATPQAAFNWAKARYATPVVLNLVICTDMEIAGLNISGSQFSYVNVSGKTAAVKLTLTAPISIGPGSLQISNIALEGNGLECFFRVSGSYGSTNLVTLGNLTLNGSVTTGTIFVMNGAQAMISQNIAGTVSGKKHHCAQGGMLIGASKLPGSEVGTADANSKAFG